MKKIIHEEGRYFCINTENQNRQEVYVVEWDSLAYEISDDILDAISRQFIDEHSSKLCKDYTCMKIAIDKEHYKYGVFDTRNLVVVIDAIYDKIFPPVLRSGIKHVGINEDSFEDKFIFDVSIKDFDGEIDIHGYPVVRTQKKYVHCKNEGLAFIGLEHVMYYPGIAETYWNENRNPRYCMNKDGSWGLYNVRTRSLLVNCTYDRISLFDYSNNIYSLQKECRMGLFDAQRQTVLVDCVYDNISSIESNKNMYLLQKDGHWGLFDAQRQAVLVDCVYDTISPIDSKNNTYLLQKDNCYQIASIEDVALHMSDIYSTVEPIGDNLYKVSKGKDVNRYGLIKNLGESLIKCSYLQLGVITTYPLTVVLLKDNKKMQYLNVDNKTILMDDMDYCIISYGYIYFHKDGKQGFMNCGGGNYYLIDLPLNYKMDLSTFGYDFVVVYDKDNTDFVGILNVQKAEGGDVNIFSKEEWHGICEGYIRDFSGELSIKVELKNGGYVKYDEKYNEIFRGSEEDGVDDKREIDSDNIEPFFYEGSYNNDNDPLDAFDGDVDAYNEWRNR